MKQGIERLRTSLDEVFRIARDRFTKQTWRRDPQDFARRLFQQAGRNPVDAQRK